MADGETDPYSYLGLNDLIGLEPKAAVALAEAKGVEKIRVVAIVNGVTVGAVDMTLDRNRLDLACENGLVVLAFFPTNRHAGV